MLVLVQNASSMLLSRLDAQNNSDIAYQSVYQHSEISGWVMKDGEHESFILPPYILEGGSKRLSGGKMRSLEEEGRYKFATLS